MPFPITPAPEDDPRQFLIHDPFRLRRAVVPLLEWDYKTQLYSGLGSAFRIDPFGTFLSAQHVIEHRLPEFSTGSDNRNVVVGLLGMGLAYGHPSIPRDCFCTIPQASSFRGVVDDPILQLQGRQRTKNNFDCVKLIFDPNNAHLRQHVSILPLRVRATELNIGDRLMAIGFPKINAVERETKHKVAMYSEEMFAAIGEVTALYRSGRDAKAPWPTLEVRGQWPQGMSGGPIFNEAGEVIGLVSSGLDPSDDGEGLGYGFWFGPLADFHKWLPTIDPDNPGWIRGWLVFRSDPFKPVACFPDKLQAEQRCVALSSGHSVHFGSVKHGTDEYLLSEEIGK